MSAAVSLVARGNDVERRVRRITEAYGAPSKFQPKKSRPRWQIMTGASSPRREEDPPSWHKDFWAGWRRQHTPEEEIRERRLEQQAARIEKDVSAPEPDRINRRTLRTHRAGFERAIRVSDLQDARDRATERRGHQQAEEPTKTLQRRADAHLTAALSSEQIAKLDEVIAKVFAKYGEGLSPEERWDLRQHLVLLKTEEEKAIEAGEKPPIENLGGLWWRIAESWIVNAQRNWAIPEDVERKVRRIESQPSYPSEDELLGAIEFRRADEPMKPGAIECLFRELRESLVSDFDAADVKATWGLLAKDPLDCPYRTRVIRAGLRVFAPEVDLESINKLTLIAGCRPEHAWRYGTTKQDVISASREIVRKALLARQETHRISVLICGGEN